MHAIRQLTKERLESRVVLSAVTPMSGKPEWQEVIVVLEDQVDRPADFARETLSNHGGQPRHVFEHAFRGFSASLPEPAIKALERNPLVRLVEPNATFHLEHLTPIQRAAPPPAEQVMPTGITRVHADDNPLFDANGPFGIRIGVIDTGIDKDHPDLNVAGGVNFVGAALDDQFDDGHGHGTHVSGTIGAINNDRYVVGMAPGIDIWAAKSFGNNGRGDGDDILAAMDAITETRTNGDPTDDIAVVNMSFSTGLFVSESTELAVAAMANAGVVLVAAAGNGGYFGAEYPARDEHTICVVALADSNGDESLGPDTRDGPDETIADFSNTGSVDVVAPGVDILSTWKGGGTKVKSGTSMATPHVTGAAALFITEYAAAWPGGLPQDLLDTVLVREALVQTAIETGDYVTRQDDPSIGAHVLDASSSDNANYWLTPPVASYLGMVDDMGQPAGPANLQGTVTIQIDARDVDTDPESLAVVAEITPAVGGDTTSIQADFVGVNGNQKLYEAVWDTDAAAEGDYIVTVLASYGEDNESDPTARATVNDVLVTVGDTFTLPEISVGDLDGSSTEKGKSGKWQASVEVHVVDTDATPVVGAVVRGSWSGAVQIANAAAVTGSDGIARFETGSISGGDSVAYTVEDVGLDNFRYAPASNTDPDGDSNGTTIVVTRPGASSAVIDANMSSSESNASSLVFVTHDVIPTAPDGPNSVFAADMDGDGDIDVLSASQGDDKIAWYENTDGQGTFGPLRVISTDSDYAKSVFAADMDGDGDADVISASGAYGRYAKIVWHENIDGQGTFGTERVISTEANSVRSLFASDVDGDGDVDVLSASVSDNKIAWYENTDGQGTFGPQSVITTEAENALSVHAADVDGDGDVDVLSASQRDNKIAWYENTDGQGTFGQQSVITTETENARSVYTADVDGDGDMDVLSASWDDNKIAWYQNTDGQGTFGPQRVISTKADFANEVVAADIDGDGDPDVVSSSGWNSENGKFAWYENTDGAGTFGPQRVFSTTTQQATSVFAVDLDSDGDVDVLTATSTDNTIAWYKNTDGEGEFGPQRAITWAPAGPTSVIGADVDDDGDLDVLSASHWDDKIAWYENTGGQYGQQRVISTEADDASSIDTADVDGDGDVDVLSASAYDDKVAWYENTDGKGSFGPQSVISTEADYAQSVFAADVDGDGDIDVLSASQGDDKIAWYENSDGLGTFGPQQVISTEAFGATSVYADDVDGDGDMDVLSASHADDTIAWYENTNGKGTFGPQLVISTEADIANTVFAADLDGDGDVDVLSASFDDDKIAWYENTDGKGTFGPQTVISTEADGARSVYAVDMDGDGDVDVVSASFDDDKIAWYENTDGQGTFGPQTVISAAANGAHSVFAVDMDADGDMDVLAAAHHGDQVIWYESRIAGDFDGDGDVDSADRTILVQNWTGALKAGEGDKTFDQGDTDGDGDVDSADQTRLIQNWTGAMQQAKPFTVMNAQFAAVDDDELRHARDARAKDAVFAAAGDILEEVSMQRLLHTGLFVA